MGSCCQNQQNTSMDIDEPPINIVPHLQAKKGRNKIAQVVADELTSVVVRNQQYAPLSDSVRSLDESDYRLSNIKQSSTKYTTKGSLPTKHSINQNRQAPNTSQFSYQKYKVKRINSFYLDDDYHSADQDSWKDETIMEVDFKFRHEAILSIQKILESNKALK